MATLRTRFLAGSLTFVANLTVHRFLMSATSASQPTQCTEVTSTIKNLRTQTTGAIEGKSKPIVIKVSQADEIRFDGVGLVRITAHEDIGSTPKLVFTKVPSGEELLNVYVGNSNWVSHDDHLGMNPKLRFKVERVKGLPSPLVIGLAINPGGSDDAWESFAVGAINGELEDLTYEHLQTEDEGGFFFGDLGIGSGLGAAQWNFVWGEDEGHPPPHRYELKLYRWNGRRFSWEKVLRTRAKYNSGSAALRANGFHYIDMRKSFPEWSDIDTW